MLVNLWKFFSPNINMFSSLLVYLTLTCLIRVKKKLWCKVVLYAGCWGCLSMIIYVGDLMNLPPTLAVFLICIFLACEGTALKKLTIGLMISSVLFAFNGLHDTYLEGALYRMLPGAGHFFEWYERNIARLLFALILYLWVRAQKQEPDFELDASLWKLLLLLCLPPFGIVVSLVLFRSPYYTSSGTRIADASLFLIAVFALGGLLWALKVLNRQKMLEQENLLAQHNTKYYEAMEQQQFEIRRLKHDLANHLQTLLSLPEDEKDQYIHEILSNPGFAQVLKFSEDATVNAVLTAKDGLIQQKGIRFYKKVEIMKELPFAKVDICALFANALDNAAESCEKLAEEDREISLEARAAKGILAVCIKNTCGEEEKDSASLRTGAGKHIKLPQTTKADAENHGFGLRSIREVVKKYGGSMEIEKKEGIFTLFLYLPFPEEAGQSRAEKNKKGVK